MPPVRKVSHVREISPAGPPRAGDAIHRVAAALRADEAQAPFQHWQIGTMAGCLLAGVDIDPVPAAIAPGAQQQIRPGRAAERAWVIAPHDGDDAPAEGISAEPAGALCCRANLQATISAVALLRPPNRAGSDYSSSRGATF